MLNEKKKNVNSHAGNTGRKKNKKLRSEMHMENRMQDLKNKNRHMQPLVTHTGGHANFSGQSVLC